MTHHKPGHLQTASSNLKFATFNVRGLNSVQKQAAIKKLADSRHIDALRVQETTVTSAALVERLQRSRQARMFHSPAVGRSAGVMIAVFNLDLSSSLLHRPMRIVVSLGAPHCAGIPLDTPGRGSMLSYCRC